ncbi:hypothetical protein HWQ46_18125 [Shewanella sp. D64]|uniref:hypothetical protein n=1 Tax=unclassified Shewanella TaxID=196818 RepID=UPI0022BA4A31|nr:MULTISPECIES: hypothetical protein [unclassified Shewanella]MEC4727465.1 hypothetical protein [Shewanella sp. D64]MEC4738126.1 hypothetical protein [Shewanella sp. E94]WBJ96361.1 hypothetical protein HWQ47_04345 [Shewanella sp. MTB7]
MKKILIAAAVIAASAAGYWVSQDMEANGESNAILAFVPADTPVFSGQLTPFPIKAYINSVSPGYQSYSDDMFAELEESDDARAKFMLSLIQTYMASLVSGDTFISTFGLPEQMRSYFYTLGLLPVIKLEVEKPEAIWTVLDKAEKESGFTHEKKSIKGQEYRAYALTDADESETIFLLFSISNGILTVTLDSAFSQPSTLETALGLTPVTNSLADSDILQDIMKTHGFNGDGIGYINHQELVKAVTTKDGNQLARQLMAFAELEGEDPFAMLRSNECHTELSAIVANWPRTVFGVSNVSISDILSHIEFATIVESKNQVMLDALSSMQGFIPDYIRQADSVFSMGLGLDMNQLAPSLTAIWDDMLTPQYQCQVLQEAQEEVSGQSPAMLGMFTGMANGVKGLAASVIDYQFNDDQDNPGLKSLDAIISLSAENPSMLFNMVKSFAPELASIQLTNNNEAVDLSPLLPILPELGIKPMMAIRGEHLVIFSGEAGEVKANELVGETLNNQSLYSFGVDYGKVIPFLITLSEMAGEPISEELSMMKGYNMQVRMGIDVNQTGIVFDSVMDSKVAPANE